MAVTRHSWEVEAEIRNFYAAKIEPVLMPFCYGRSPFKRLQTRHNELIKIVRAKYGRPFEVMAALNRLEDRQGAASKDRHVPFGFSAAHEGVHTVAVFIPSVMEAWSSIQASTETRKDDLCRAFLLGGFMHEVEHAAHNPNPMPETEEAFLDAERVAWGHTCEHTLDVLVRQYHYPLTSVAQDLYDKWLQCGSNIDSPCWADAVHRVYAGSYMYMGQSQQPQVVPGSSVLLQAATPKPASPFPGSPFSTVPISLRT